MQVKDVHFMSKVGFNKNLAKSCAYCVYGTVLEGFNEAVCKKRGVTKRHQSCRSYVYDPLKRVPQKPKSIEKYSEEDFIL